MILKTNSNQRLFQISQRLFWLIQNSLFHVAGDNILTAINVARKCEIIQPGKKVVHVEAVPPLNGDKLDVQYQTIEFHKETAEVSTKEPVVSL